MTYPVNLNVSTEVMKAQITDKLGTLPVKPKKAQNQTKAEIVEMQH